MECPHVPVLQATVLEFFSGRPLRCFVDGTLGLGGHAQALLEAHPELSLYIGIDRDAEGLQWSRSRLAEHVGRLQFEEGDYGDMGHVAPRAAVEGILLDLGVSSLQLDSSSRGFTFRDGAALDMRMSPGVGASAADLLASLRLRELESVFRDFGEVPAYRAAAHAIVEARSRAPICTTTDLMAALRHVRSLRRSLKLHPLTLVMQALRIAVNDELGQLQRGLAAAVELLAPGGRLVVISYHSGEDRIVKQFFRHCPTLRILTKKPLVADALELRANPRSRSAKLRACELIS